MSSSVLTFLFLFVCFALLFFRVYCVLSVQVSDFLLFSVSTIANAVGGQNFQHKAKTCNCHKKGPSNLVNQSTFCQLDGAKSGLTVEYNVPVFNPSAIYRSLKHNFSSPVPCKSQVHIIRCTMFKKQQGCC